MKKKIKYWIANKLKLFVGYKYELKYKDKRPDSLSDEQCIITKHYKEIFGHRFYPTNIVEESCSLKWLWDSNALGAIWKQVTF